MDFRFVPLTIDLVREIDSWDYRDFVEKVTMDDYFDSYSKTETLIGPGGCRGFAALSGNETAGLFEFIENDEALEIGLALRPDLTGKGLGAEYVRQGIEFGMKQYGSKVESIRLTVNHENVAAIRSYEKLGFQRVGRMDDDIDMVLPLAGS